MTQRHISHPEGLPACAAGHNARQFRNQLHVMATTVVPNFCDLAAGLQADVQALIDDHSGTYPEERL
ncbi:hypothetical protein [Stenotrophomonas sp. 364]|uniref:hypothetical protein n=1 Tax=Stenotrophomonas sp. 364 TaxID=2691571 RepID=UPI0013199C9D|nr:hypothetical protein [Stenotrophomonas sp. 364]QHB72044.1 hypothetical protein GQ674_12405 [Stenotrophomonas sp. 364]